MPQSGPQAEAIRKHWVDELFYGGAVGGGKSDYLLGDYAQDVPNYGAAWRGILFRKTYGELEELINRSLEIYPAWFPGASWADSHKTWTFANGATLKLRYLEHSKDWMRYWGHQYTWIGWDELPSWTDLLAYHKMKARLRSAHAIPNKRIRSTGNPGGPSHTEVKSYFGIDKHPMGGHVLTDPVSGSTRMFVRSRLNDNRILLKNDPNYANRLMGLGSDTLVKAWLEGDWSVIQGAFFDCWSTDKHVIRPCKLPDHWIRFRSMDWGSARPFSIGWWTVASEDLAHPEDGRIIPKGAIVRYREWYGAPKNPDGTTQPNVGLKMTAEAVAEGIISREMGEKIAYGTADPSIFAQDGGPSIAERMNGKGLVWRHADNKRVSEKGHLGGWDMMRQRLMGEDDKPMLYVFSTCSDFIRTVPALQHDEDRMEDIDTEGEDHVGDETRYACTSRPYTRPAPQTGPLVVTPKVPTFNDLLKKAAKRRVRN